MAMYNLSILMQSVALDTKNDAYSKEGLVWMQKAAENNLEAAFTPLAQALLPVSKDEALKYFEKAMECGDLKANLCMGALCAKNQNINAALTFWHKAVTSEVDEERWPSNYNSIAECFYRIGNLYFLGRHPDELDPVEPQSYKDLISRPVETEADSTPSYSIASEFWQLALEADSKHAKSALHLGNLHFDGISMPKNYERAAHYYSKALESGNVSNEQRQTLEGLLLICYNHLGIKPPYDLITNLPISEIKPKRAQPFIRLFTPEEEVVDYEMGAINGWKQADHQSKTIHDAIANRWKFIEDYAQL